VLKCIPVSLSIMSDGIRGLIKPRTIERLGKYAPVKLGMSADELINDALDSIEERRKK
jgi:hypothetical protein